MAITYEQARRTIRGHFDGEWQGVVPTLYQNEPETVGDARYFARLSIRPASSRQIAVGPQKFRRRGVVFVQLFAAQSSGTDGLGALEEKAVSIFEGRTIDGITFRQVGSDDVGPDGRGYYQVNVTANFQYDTN